jgi:hypothetical protein
MPLKGILVTGTLDLLPDHGSALVHPWVHICGTVDQFATRSTGASAIATS